MSAGPVAIDLDDVLADTHPLWADWLAGTGSLLGVDAASLPEDRVEAAARLDELGAGNWRALLQRFAEERVPLYVRRDPDASSALRALASSGRAVGVFTDAPEPLARVVLGYLGADRRVTAVETGAGALDRLLATLGADTLVLRTRADLLSAATGVT